MDYQGLAESIDEVRESLRAMVAALVADGYTEDQARGIVAGLLAHKPEPSDGT